MKLAALGVVTAGIGMALAAPGLIGIGVYWVGMGLLVRRHGQKLKGLATAAAGDAGTPAGSAEPAPAIDGRTFATGTALWLSLGLPSVAVGILELGISSQDENWRWLPIGVGGLALGIGVISAIMYLLGSAAIAVAERGPAKDVAATIWIRAVKETGTYVNERPRLEFRFQVEPDPGTGVASYEVTKKATVPFTAMGSLRVGDGFKAKVAGPESPTAMDIAWNEPVSDGTRAGGSPRDPAEVSTRLDELDRLRREEKITEEEYDAQRERILGSL